MCLLHLFSYYTKFFWCFCVFFPFSNFKIFNLYIEYINLSERTLTLWSPFHFDCFWIGIFVSIHHVLPCQSLSFFFSPHNLRYVIWPFIHFVILYYYIDDQIWKMMSFCNQKSVICMTKHNSDWKMQHLLHPIMHSFMRTKHDFFQLNLYYHIFNIIWFINAK